MLSGGRKVCSAIVWLWVCIVGLCKRLVSLPLKRQPLNTQVNFSKHSSTGNVGTSPATGQEMEWEESWNTMEPFSVTVVPTERDLFQDMQPVLTKTRKVYIGRGETEEKSLDKCKFAVETQFSGQESNELGEWGDEEMVEEGGGWEGETGREEVASRQVMAQLRRDEREKRKKLQEALRFSQRRQQQQPSLGVRLSDSS